LIIWDVTQGKQLVSVRGGFSHKPRVAFTPDGTQIAFASGGSVQLLESTTGKQLSAYLSPSTSVTPNTAIDVALSPNGTTLASVEVCFPNPPPSTAGFFYQVTLWDIPSGQRLAVLDKQPNKISCVAFSPDGRRLASGGWDGTTKLWDVATETEQSSFQGNMGHVNCVAFSPDGKTLAAGGRNGAIQLWNVP
jgi:WD40 repeat protein